MKKQSCYVPKGGQRKEAVPHASTFSWGDKLMGKVNMPQVCLLSQGEECLIRGQVCSCDLSYRIQVEDLFRKHSTCGW